jgi:hypothetical protein
MIGDLARLCHLPVAARTMVTNWEPGR